MRARKATITPLSTDRVVTALFILREICSVVKNLKRKGAFFYISEGLWFILMYYKRGQLPVGLTAQLLEHCTSIAEVMGLNPVQA